MDPSRTSGARYLLVPTLQLSGMSRLLEVELCLTARPRSPMAQDPEADTRMFLLLRSRWAMAGLPWVPWISRWRWVSPVAMSRQILTA